MSRLKIKERENTADSRFPEDAARGSDCRRCHRESEPCVPGPGASGITRTAFRLSMAAALSATVIFPFAYFQSAEIKIKNMTNSIDFLKNLYKLLTYGMERYILIAVS